MKSLTHPPVLGKSNIARGLVSVAERNLANLALQAVRECKTATHSAEIEQIAAAGLVISHARNLVLRHILEGN